MHPQSVFIGALAALSIMLGIGLIRDIHRKLKERRAYRARMRDAQDAAEVRAAQKPEVQVEVDARQVDLGLAIVRERLERWIKTAGLEGDANVRRGKVVETIHPDEVADRGSSLRVRTHVLLGKSSRGAMRGTDLYYCAPIKNPLPGQPEFEYKLADVSLDDLASLVVLAERVAEDRRRSRSLYKGITDEQLITISRTAVAQVYPDDKADIRRGEWDDRLPITIAKAAVSYLFEVKGATA